MAIPEPATPIVDPITLEVLRTRLDAISDESAVTIERTAISPVVTESKDYSATILDGDGNLVTGGGRIEYHFGAAMNAVRSTLARHGDTIRPRDVFLANDPHNGGGLHAQDVMVQQPVFVGDELVAWVVNSAHLMDMGGMVMGSWAPAATECYQEAIRFPPVRLFRAGVEEPDVFAIFRNNVRLSALVEMDLRALVAGCHVAEDKLIDVVEHMGVAEFRTAVRALCDSGERELRRRIEALADGEYRVETWTEWGEELYAVPVVLTVAGDRLIFDFTGTSPQAPHFFNSKPYIIESELVADVCSILAQDLPFSAGLFRPFELRCPEGSIVNSQPPAPVASAHMDAAFCAATVGTQAVVLALAASPGAFGRQYLSGPAGTSGLATHTWGCQVDGAFDGWAMLDGCLPAPSAGHDRDGNDLFSFLVGRQGIVEFIDVEILESWYPLLVHEKKPRPGAFGAGTFRSGAGCQMSYEPYGTDALHGVMLAMRERLPLTGMAGGFPGATTSFRIHRADGTVEAVDGHAMDVVVRDGDTFEFLCASGGGWGDPLERDPALVAHDVALGRITGDDAGAVYGVELAADGEPVTDATARRRDGIRADRLARARPAATPAPTEPAEPAADPDGDAPLYPGVIQRGRHAVSAATGAVLAEAPHHWTDGCPVIEEHVTHGRLELVVETYLDPRSGGTLAVDVRPIDAPRTFTSAPTRWQQASRRPGGGQ
jgi:N-methylhydantoinase B